VDTTGATAWREGWNMSLEKTIADVLMPEGRPTLLRLRSDKPHN
jgi:hypothetical protein